MPTTTDLTCPHCGYGNDGDVPSCGMCGAILRQRSAQRPPLVERVEHVERVEPEPETIFGLPESAFFLLVGAVLAPIFTFTPLLQRMGWFLSALVHEMGHTIAALFVGCSAFPAIRLDGHAMTSHGPQHTILVYATWGALGFLAWKFRGRRAWLITFAAAAVAYPLLAFTFMKEVVHLLGGHVGELVFAVIFLWRALSGGFTQQRSERVAYSTLAWYFVGCNVWLAGGLIFSVKVQHWYSNNGSFGLTNDYIRLAGHLDWKLGSVAGLMLVTSLLAVPIGCGAARLKP